MSIDKIRITNLLELRYDYMSARNVLNNWQKQSGIKEDLNDFSDAQIRSLVIYLKNNAPEASRTIGGLERLILNADNEPVVEAAPVVEEAVVEAAPAEDVAVEDAPAEEAAVEDAPMADDNAIVEAETEVKADENVDDAAAPAQDQEAAKDAAPAKDSKKKSKNKK